MIRRIKGTQDILPGEIKRWQDLETVMRNVSRLFNFTEIRTPIFESSELFHRSVGETTDIVKKETYDFEDRGKRMNTLRPEGTASVVRSVIENKLYVEENLPLKLYYYGPMFRYERPQKGRQRQFHQFGAEVIGSDSPLADAEIINFAATFLEALKIKNVQVRINSLGDAESKEKYQKALKEYLEPNVKNLCEDCNRRYVENPLRVLDCKIDKDNEALINAPKPYDYLSDKAKVHFEQVIMALESIGLNYKIDKNLVRGLDYYTHTVFEIDSDLETLGAQSTLVGGGRYNNLYSSLEGPDLGAVGFAFGVERLLLALEAINQETETDNIHAYFIALGDVFQTDALEIINDLRHGGLVIDYDFFNKNLKGQFKQADRMNPKFYLIYGEEEAKAGVVNVKSLATKEQEQVKVEELYQYLVNQLTGRSCSGGCSSCDGC
ncbi:MAG: histidine--tRNA ligase [Candidatus Izemoplasmatales bacterium]|jgi:histidyl-tRNA synthetase|nr:histidine--tRNA ligase [Candidatus Izemoplasmatales bacterium]